MAKGEDAELTGSPILTARLILKRPDAGERAAIAALAANPRVAENLAAAPEGFSGQPRGAYVVVERGSAAVVGAAAFGPVGDRQAVAEIASFVGEPFWGRGYATEATQALIDSLFVDDDFLVLWCANRATNTRARRVIEKCGFQFRGSGMMRSPALRVAVPVERFVLDRRNWESLKAWGANGSSKRRQTDEPRHDAA